jgi:hypothetical protein
MGTSVTDDDDSIVFCILSDTAVDPGRVRRARVRAIDGGGNEEPAQRRTCQPELPQIHQAVHAGETVIAFPIVLLRYILHTFVHTIHALSPKG